VEELNDYQNRNGSNNKWTRKALLAYHSKQGHIKQVRQGLYAVVPPGAAPDTFKPDPYLIAGKLFKDSVLSFHTALEIQGLGYSVFHEYYFFTHSYLSSAELGGHRFRSVRFPKALIQTGQENLAVKNIDKNGVTVRVTSLERTMVDLLHRPELGGGWEEIWRSLEAVPYFDLDMVIKYALLLGNATTIAKVGYFLQENQDRLMVEKRHLDILKKEKPKKPHYMDRRYNQGSKLMREWNLIVPDLVAERKWEEPG
jgi:predicted transcriptional regulator of viral defense system